MVKLSEKEIEEVDRIQNKFEKIELENIQKDYKTKIPVFIWFIKIGLILSILSSLIGLIFYLSIDYLFILNGLSASLSIFLLYGIINRKRWALYLGVSFYVLGLLFCIFYKSPFYWILQLIMIFLFIWHKDYLNK